MNKRELEILRIGFEAGKKAIEMHPDDDEYDTIRFEEAQEQVKNLTIPNVVGQSEQLSLSVGGHYNCPECGESLHVSDYEHKCWA